MGLRQENPEGVSILIVCSVFAALATLGVAMRFRSRMMLRQQLALSDYTIIAALILAYGNMVVLGLCESPETQMASPGLLTRVQLCTRGWADI